MIQSESDPLPPNPPYQPSAGLIGTETSNMINKDINTNSNSFNHNMLSSLSSILYNFGSVIEQMSSQLPRIGGLGE